MNRGLIALCLLATLALASSQQQMNLWQLITDPNTGSDFTILSNLIQKYNLRPLFDNSSPVADKYTLFAPTDAAFKVAKINLTRVFGTLAYHVIPGVALSSDIPSEFIYTDNYNNVKSFTVTGNDGAFRYSINGQANIDIVRSNQKASNGVLHVIDAVLTLPTGPSNMSIIDSLRADGRFTILTKALDLTGLSYRLQGYRWTVFAPTDAAFSAVPPAIIQALLADPNNLLLPVLYNHVIPNSVVFSSALVDGEIVKSDIIDVRVSLSKGVFINNAQVVEADAFRRNGVIHVIDKVLFPN